MSRRVISVLALFIVGAVVVVQISNAAAKLGNTVTYPNYGPAPELTNEVWLNSENPLSLEELRGQVVLLHFWTFDCINCIRTLPYVETWWETYQDQGLTVIGNHYPEFDYEADLNNLEAAIERLGVTYPVAQDNDGVTWRAYRQRYWPTLYLIDRSGDIRYRHIGEGRYVETEAAIQALLAEPYPSDASAEAPKRQNSQALNR
jgi:thiol-disulfide isomerase/thioredoxin